MGHSHRYQTPAVPSNERLPGDETVDHGYSNNSLKVLLIAAGADSRRMSRVNHGPWVGFTQITVRQGTNQLSISDISVNLV